MPRIIQSRFKQAAAAKANKNESKTDDVTTPNVKTIKCQNIKQKKSEKTKKTAPKMKELPLPQKLGNSSSLSSSTVSDKTEPDEVDTIKMMLLNMKRY